MEAPGQTRKCERGRVADAGCVPRGFRQICVPMTQEQYDRIWNDGVAVRNSLNSLIVEHPEIFPPSACDAYQLHGQLPESRKQHSMRTPEPRRSSQPQDIPFKLATQPTNFSLKTRVSQPHIESGRVRKSDRNQRFADDVLER